MKSLPKFPMNRNEWMRQFGPEVPGLLITEEAHTRWLEALHKKWLEEYERNHPRSKPPAVNTKDPAMECTDPTVYCVQAEEGPKIYRGDNLILVESPSLFMWFLDRKPLTLKQKNCAPYYHLIRQGLEFREIQL